MKHTLLLCLLLLCSIITPAQYEAAVRYRATTPTFTVAADTLIQRAIANPTDSGGEGGEANALTIMQQGNTAGNAYWDPRGLPAGIYIYTASDDRGIVCKGKIVVVR